MERDVEDMRRRHEEEGSRKTVKRGRLDWIGLVIGEKVKDILGCSSFASGIVAVVVESAKLKVQHVWYQIPFFFFAIGISNGTEINHLPNTRDFRVRKASPFGVSPVSSSGEKNAAVPGFHDTVPLVYEDNSDVVFTAVSVASTPKRRATARHGRI